VTLPAASTAVVPANHVWPNDSLRKLGIDPENDVTLVPLAEGRNSDRVRLLLSGDIAAMMASVAKDFKMKFAFTNPGSDKEVVQDLDREQLEFNARHNLRIRRAYKLERKNMKIKIYDDQTAMVTSEVYEVFTMKQGTLRGSSSEELFVALENGKLVIKSANLRTRLY